MNIFIRLFLLVWLLSVTACGLALNPASVFDIPWQDQAVFKQDLLPAYQAMLPDLSEAPVYHLDMVLKSDTEVAGQLELRLSNTSVDSWYELVFHLYPNALGSTMHITEVQVNGQNSTYDLNDLSTLLRIRLDTPLAPGEESTVFIAYDLTVTDTIRNFGRLSKYPDALSLAHAYPSLARYQNGSWDTTFPAELGDPLVANASFFVVQVTASPDVQLVASGRMIAEETSDATQTVRFAAGPARDFYLVALSNYVQLSQVAGDTVINSYVPPVFANVGNDSLSMAARALELFSSKFVPYPYREFDMIALPVQAGGIEYPGIINLSMSLYRDAGGLLESVIAHEIAHQWSFNLVGNDQLAEPFLDESLAQYLTLLYHKAFKTSRSVDSYLRFWQTSWDEAPDPQKPVGLPVEAYNSWDYSAIVYAKGLFFYQYLSELMGQNQLELALRSYYQEYSWQFVYTEDLQRSLENACACDLSEVFKTWITGP